MATSSSAGQGAKANPTLTLSLEAFCVFLLWVCSDADVPHIGLGRLRARLTPLVTRSGMWVLCRPFVDLRPSVRPARISRVWRQCVVCFQLHCFGVLVFWCVFATGV